jgi:hypothetical protein
MGGRQKELIMNVEKAGMAETVALLDRLRENMPEIWNQAQVVGKWVWLEFTMPPIDEVRSKLKGLGFHWNGARRCWQQPCGLSRPASAVDPKRVFPVVPAPAMQLNEEAAPANHVAKEFKIVALRECPLPDSMHVCDSPDRAANYWRMHISTNPYYNPECECFVVLLLNTRRHVKGHQLVSIGTLDTILVHPREVFRCAIIAAASAIIVMHNHPSGDPTPSEGDIKATRDLIRAGQLLKMDLLDHVIVGNPKHCSLRELGYFFT